jgi:hypothetical protein
VKIIDLTEKGVQSVRESMRARHAWLDDLASIMTEQDKDSILPALSTLNKYTKKLKDDLHRHNTQPNMQ